MFKCMFSSLEKGVRGMLANLEELNKNVSAYSKYMIDKQRHDNIVQNLMQKRVGFNLFDISF